MHPTSHSPAGPHTPCTWLTDRLPLTHRITGPYRVIWALHASGRHDDAVAAQLKLPLADVQTAIRSVYRALAIDPDDGELARAQARQLYWASTTPGTIRTGPAG